MAQHLADGWLSDKQLFRRAGKALLANNFDKITQGTHVHNDPLNRRVCGERQNMPIWNDFDDFNSFLYRFSANVYFFRSPF
jgi:hypothetical protein